MEDYGDDVGLMRQVAEGSQPAMAHLWDLYGDSAVAYVEKRASAWILSAEFPHGVMEDLVVDAVSMAFEDLVRGAAWWDPAKGWSLRTFFCTRARQRLVRLANAERRRQRLGSRLRELGVQQREIKDDPEELVIEQMEQVEREQFIWSAVESLPEESQRALTLRFVQDLSFKQIASALDVSEAAAKARVYRAIQALRSDLS